MGGDQPPQTLLYKYGPFTPSLLSTIPFDPWRKESMGEGSNLPPGFRFFPSDEELVVHFLRRKASLLPCNPDIIPTLSLLRCDPWDLNGTRRC